MTPSARWTPTELNNPLTNQPFTLYRWANRDDSEDDFLITNVEGFQFRTPDGQVIGTLDPRRTYRALMLVLTKRYTNRWQAQVSYVLSKATGNVDNTGNQQIASSIFETPNRSLVNATHCPSGERLGCLFLSSARKSGSTCPTTWSSRLA